MNLSQIANEVGAYALSLATRRGKRSDEQYPTLVHGGRVVDGRVVGGREISIRLVKIWRPAAGYGGFELIADTFDLSATRLAGQNVVFVEPGEGVYMLRVTAAEVRHAAGELSTVRLVCR